MEKLKKMPENGGFFPASSPFPLLAPLLGDQASGAGKN
jgi:hypothetical protein